MSFTKKIFGVFLLLFAFSLIILIGMPQLYMGKDAGKITKEDSLALEFLKDEKAKVVLLYFGYAGCETICTPALQEITQIYEKVNSKNLSVYFINLLESTPEDVVLSFAKYFHEDFHGIYLNSKQLQKLQNEINITFTKSPISQGELNHAGHLYLLQKDDKTYKQKFIYTTKPYNTKLILEDIQRNLN